MTILDDRLSLAQKLAYGAGRILMRHFGHIEHIGYKTVDSIVTEADIRSEQYITRGIRRQYPEDRIFGEEQGLDQGDGEYVWVIDPLDGTTNFAAGLPLFAVSIGLLHKRKPVLGVVYDPIRKECYWASQGTEAQCNGQPIQVSDKKLSLTSLGAFGSTWHKQDSRRIVPEILSQAKGRNFGSTVLHLIQVARGVMEFALAEETRLWDVAAAGFILQQAGGRFTGLDGKRLFPLPHPIEYYRDARIPFLGSNGKTHRSVLEKIIRSRKS